MEYIIISQTTSLNVFMWYSVSKKTPKNVHLFLDLYEMCKLSLASHYIKHNYKWCQICLEKHLRYGATWPCSGFWLVYGGKRETRQIKTVDMKKKEYFFLGRNIKLYKLRKTNVQNGENLGQQQHMWEGLVCNNGSNNILGNSTSVKFRLLDA